MPRFSVLMAAFLAIAVPARAAPPDASSPPASSPPAEPSPTPVPTSEAAPASGATPSASAGAAPGAESGPTNQALAAEVAAMREEMRAMKAERASEVSSEGSDEDQRFKIYGFLDVGLKKSFRADDPFFAGLIERKLTFVLGNVNLYFDAQPLPTWRALIEARLTTYPHGDTTIDETGQFQRTDTRVFDVNSSSGRNRVIWGGVVLERAQIEHTMVDWFNVRAGYFLTPYGIWNVDHGLPTLISLLLPSFQVEEAVPQRQLGVQAYGNAWSGDWELGYAATVSNGRATFLEDPSDNKAFGVRLTVGRTGSDSSFRLGASGYIGDSLQIDKALDLSDPTQVSISETRRYQLDEWAIGADFSLDLGKFRVRTEGLIHRVTYPDGLHEATTFSAPGTFRPNRYEYYWYGILAYRFWDLEPYTYTELKYSTPRDGGFDLAYIPSLGLNWHLSAFSQLKAQYAAPKFYITKGAGDASTRNFRLIDLRYVLSF